MYDYDNNLSEGAINSDTNQPQVLFLEFGIVPEAYGILIQIPDSIFFF